MVGTKFCCEGAVPNCCEGAAPKTGANIVGIIEDGWERDTGGGCCCCCAWKGRMGRKGTESTCPC